MASLFQIIAAVALANLLLFIASAFTTSAETPVTCIATGRVIGDIAVDPASKFVYATTNDGDDSLLIIDGSTNRFHDAVTFGGNLPTAVALNPDSDMLYLGHTDGSVHVIDRTTSKIVSTLRDGKFASDIAVNPKTNMIYVANFWSDSVSVIDGNTNKVIKTIPVGPNPNGIAVNPNTNKVYVAAGASGTGGLVRLGTPYSMGVIVLDGASAEVTGFIKVGKRPTGIGVNTNTNLVYTSDFTSSSVSVIDGTRDAVIANLTVGAGPTKIEVDANRNTIYVLNTISKSISVIDGERTNVTATLMVGHGVGDDSMAIDAGSGRIFLGVVGPKSIMGIDPSTISASELATVMNCESPTSNPLPDVMMSQISSALRYAAIGFGAVLSTILLYKSGLLKGRGPFQRLESYLQRRAGDRPSKKSPSLWRWPYVALTEVAIIEILGALYMLSFFFYVNPFLNHTQPSPELAPSLPPYFAFLVGGILIFLKRKSGVLVSIAGIAYFMGFGLYHSSQSASSYQEFFVQLKGHLLGFTDPYGIPSLSVGLLLLVIGWRKLSSRSLRTATYVDRWESISDEYAPGKSQPGHWYRGRVALFIALPIVSVNLLYFVFISDIRAALRSTGLFG